MLALALALALVNLTPVRALAQDYGKVVRVGWYESPFNRTDEFGRRSGYAYEYQQKISAYTGWVYEYVEGSWPQLLQMLIDGRIDLLSDVSYTPEREESMLFSFLPMGEEEYCIFISPDNQEITLEDLSTFNGKKVGANKDSVQIKFFQEWAEKNGVQAEIVEMMDPLERALEKLALGEIDMYVAQDGYLDVTRAVPICNIGASDFYFAVSKNRPELLPDLNAAIARIQDENHYYNQQLYAKYLNIVSANLYLNGAEKAWLAEHGTIRVGYQDNYLAFCALDPKTGELTGALKDYLRAASDSMKNAHIDFEAFAYPTAAAALEALKKGELDCVFPANLTDYDGETQGYYMSPPLMRTDMSAIVRESARNTFGKTERVTVAVNAGNTNYDLFLLDYFPEWRTIYFQDTPECLRAVADGKADCLLISFFRYNNIADLCKKYHLIALSTGVEMDYCFAVNRESTLLYSILSKITGVIPAAAVNASLSYYFTEDAKSSLSDVLRQNMDVVMAILAAVALVILFLILRNVRAERKASEERQLITATETDGLTGLYNKDYFNEYANRMYCGAPERKMDAVVLNIEQFHAVNSINGRAFGDQVLHTLGEEIKTFLTENDGIACHEESDHFVMFCSHMEDYQTLFDRLQAKINALASNVGIQLRMGVAPWQKDMEPQQMIEQARTACSLARGYFKEHLVIFDENVREREAFEQRLISEMRRALEKKEFVIHYQPKYDIQTVPPTLVSAEALVRWRHPELGMIPPGDFIPLFERNGQISALDQYVWAEAARQIAEWREKLGVVVPVSVNLSRVDVFDPQLEETLDELLEKNGLAKSNLKLEVTESACTENVYQVIDVIEKLREKGYEIEMDDFGTGYSSLNMLSSMPIDILKMDRAFVSGIEHSPKDIQLVNLILGIAKNLKIPVIAEGVETEAQLRILKDMGCVLVQGYYFSRAVPSNEFEKLIENKK